MGISAIETNFLAAALSLELLPNGVDILELGESEVFGDADAYLGTLTPYLPQERVLHAQQLILEAEEDPAREFLRAHAIYHAVFNPSTYTCLDISNSATESHKIVANLNEPITFGDRQWGLTINNGTTEHIFDQANCFRAIHDATALNGTMLHWVPFSGWYNHGFFHYTDGFFFDLAEANGYDMPLVGLSSSERFLPIEIAETGIDVLPLVGERAEICVVLRKCHERPFRAPLQNGYK